ncbi:M1 family metallopeptidase [Rhizosphaericola mali]|uniref:M1 family metallopeptidase n=1 Tax=Rhizosphaericola mali TaxID=2545455 RepID=A0A5P2G1B8_9BACT|nr:M1 family metallopeptidase [Rhizosphaericola mali]QES89225.1 M1 family metallopeptidase [Rhizosphaericola mali]
MKISLPEKLAAKGGKIQIIINYEFKITENGLDRSGRLKTKNGWITEVGQWFPRMCVYDNVNGWNTLPYIGVGDFYLEYGNINYEITAPSNLLVFGSGQLTNPKEVLTETQIKRLELAKQSDKTVFIRTADEINQIQNKNQKQLTWKFFCENTRDVAWAASSAFIWDAARINLPNGKSSLAMSAYPIESVGDNTWSRSTEYAKGTIENISKYLIPYTYPTAVAIAGPVSGMEYPGIVFCAAFDMDREFWYDISHEFGHNWFPMLVGQNERVFSWMDEGFNEYLNYFQDQTFNNGEFDSQKNFNRNLVESRNKYVLTESDEAIMNRPDVTKLSNRYALAYVKPRIGLMILRNEVLGKERFDGALKYYAEQWKYKHPTPYDFFHCIENYSGESLDWFWRGWFLENWQIDQAISKVESVADSAKGFDNAIVIDNLQKMPLAVVLEIKYRNGKTERTILPVEIWLRNKTYTYNFKSDTEITNVAIDPDKDYPDKNYNNNVWSNPIFK